MRSVFIFLATCSLLAACQQKTDFEERYKEQSELIEKQGRLIEQSVEKRLKAAEEAETVLGQNVDVEPSGSKLEQ